MSPLKSLGVYKVSLSIKGAFFALEKGKEPKNIEPEKLAKLKRFVSQFPDKNVLFDFFGDTSKKVKGVRNRVKIRDYCAVLGSFEHVQSIEVFELKQPKRKKK